MSGKNIIKLQGIKIRNGAKTILSDVELVLDAGEFCYVIGKTGTGKSSLMQFLYGGKKVEEGSAFVANTDLSTLKHNELPAFRRKLGMIFQQFHLFNEWSVYRNLEFVLQATGWDNTEKMDQRIHQVLSEVDLWKMKDQLVHNMSGGEKQRLAVSRALINEPSLILADEPTGSLDPQTSKEIMQLMFNLAKQKGTSLLMTTHDLNLIQKFPGRIYECVNNTLVVKY